MTVLYLTEQGAVLRKTSRRLVVEKGGEKLLEVPSFKVESILVFGNIQLTTQAIAYLLQEGIEVSFLSFNGRYRGRLVSEESKNVFLRINQYRYYFDEKTRVEFSRTVIKGKLKNAKTLIMRYQRNHPERDFSEELQVIEECLRSLSYKKDILSLLGVEGRATAIYFRAFGNMFTKDLIFEKRSRRPPKDPVNALLSFGYVLLTNEIRSAIKAVGFDPFLGLLHGPEYGRSSLALDMCEEFRHPVVDMLVLEMFNRRMITADDFEPCKEKGWRLKHESSKKFLTSYEKRITAGDYRQLFRNQCRSLSRYFMEGVPYVPFRAR